MWDGSAVVCRRTLFVYLCIWSTLLGSCKNQFNIELLFQLRELVIKYSMLLDQRNINI